MDMKLVAAAIVALLLAACTSPDLSERLEPEIKAQIEQHISELRAEFAKKIGNNPLLALGTALAALGGESVDDAFPDVTSVDLMKISDREYSGIVRFANHSSRSIRVQFDESLTKYQWKME